MPLEGAGGATGQVSRSGTLRWSDGTTWPDDYVTILANPTTRCALFEEMRSDAAIETPLNAREQLIKSASWMLTSADETPCGVEIKEFCEDNIYPLLDTILEQLAGALQYGFGLCEPVFERLDAPTSSTIARGKVRRSTKARGRKLYLVKVARIRQRSIHTFKIADTGDLETIDQYVQVNNMLRFVRIPAARVLLWVYRQRGDDHWGVPPLRSCYAAWDYKAQLERLSVMGFDRFGVGTPVASGGPDWSDAEFKYLFDFLRRWRSGEDRALVTPHGGTVELVGGDGTIQDAFLEHMKWYTLSMAKVLLTQSTELGSTETGSRALGESFVEQTEGASQSDCEQIAAILNERLIVRMVRDNYGPQEAYPIFTPKQRVKRSAALASVLKTLKDTGFKLSAQDEAWYRDQAEMPEIDVEARQEELDAADAAAAELRDQLTQGGSDDGDEEGGDEDGNRIPRAQEARDRARRTEQARRAASTGTRGRQGGSGQGIRHSADGHLRRRHAARALTAAPASGIPAWRTREYDEWEARVARPELTARQLDLQVVRLTAEVQEALRSIDENLVAQAAALLEGGIASLGAGVGSIAVPEKLKKALRAVMLDAASRARDFGTATVHTEIARQDGTLGIGPQRRPEIGLLSTLTRAVRQLAAGAPQQTTAGTIRDIALAAEVDTAVEDEVDRREKATRSAVTSALIAAGTMAIAQLLQETRRAIQDALALLSTAVTEQNVQGVVNVGYGVGRQEAVEQYPRAVVSPSGTTTIVPPGRTIPELDDPDRRRAPVVPGSVPDPTDVPPTIEEMPVLVAKIYSAAMDGGTCDECARWDGAEFPMDYPENLTGVQAPNPRCAGTRKRCRCQWVYRTAEEVPSLVPPTRGALI